MDASAVVVMVELSWPVGLQELHDYQIDRPAQDFEWVYAG